MADGDSSKGGVGLVVVVLLVVVGSAAVFIGLNQLAALFPAVGGIIRPLPAGSASK